MGLGSIQAKFESFGFETLTVDGHNETAIENAIHTLWQSPCAAPKALVAKTVKGKGVSFMEHNNMWHYTRLNDSSYESACNELSGHGQ